MANLFNNSLVASNTTTVFIRAWAAFVHSAFMLGFVNVVDASQVDLTTLIVPSPAGTSLGYKIYKTNDALTPVYFKIEFGCPSSVSLPGLWITIGTGYTLGGTINGVVLLARTLLVNSAYDILTTHNCFASGASNRVCFALFTSLNSMSFWFSFERRKDTNLVDTDTGVLIDYGLSSSGHASLCAPFLGIIPVKETGFQFILSTNNPAAYSNVVPQGLRIPCLGPSEPPGTNIAFCNSNDYGSFAEPVLTINATDIKFKHCGPYINTLRGASSGCVDANTRLLLRYD